MSPMNTKREVKKKQVKNEFSILKVDLVYPKDTLSYLQPFIDFTHEHLSKSDPKFKDNLKLVKNAKTINVQQVLYELMLIYDN